jgi:thiol:disulfide interchange protein
MSNSGAKRLTIQSEHIVAFYYGIGLASTPLALPLLFFLSVCIQTEDKSTLSILK